MSSEALKAIDHLQRAMRLWPDKASTAYKAMEEVEKLTVAEYQVSHPILVKAQGQ